VPEALDEFVSAREVLLKLSEEVSAEDLHLFYQIALIGRRDLPLSPDARNGFEMILLRMLAFRPAGVDAARLNQTSVQSNFQPAIKPQQSAQNKNKTVSNAAAQVSSTGSVADGSGSPSYDTPPASMPAATRQNTAVQPSSIQAVSGDWREIVNALGLGGLVKQLAINCTMQQREGCKIVLHIASGHSNLINPKAKQRLQQALGEYFNIDAQLEIKVVTQNESGNKSETPAQTTQRETNQRQQQAEQSINEDSFTQTLKENFNAELIPGSVKPIT